MSSLSILLRFTLEKRICNRTFLYWNLGLLGLILALFFCDFIILFFVPAFFEPKPIYVAELSDFAEWGNANNSFFTFIPLESDTDQHEILEAGRWIIQYEAQYQIISKEEIPANQYLALQQILLSYDQTHNEKTSMVLPVVSLVLESQNHEENQAWAFLMITSIYFIALGYVGSVASDVVYEKSTRMMELILTSVSSSTHLIAKLLGGWLALILQVACLGGALLGSFLLRYGYDQAKGLWRVLVQFQLIEKEIQLDLGKLLGEMISEYELLPKLLFGLSFMLLGILFVQTILVILSSFISSVEESGAIQSPFYLLFMGVYYLTLFLNTPEQMNSGLGRGLSMLPFFSMLFMPCRMFYYQVSWLEIFISLAIAVVALILLWLLGAPIYQIGVLDYSSQPMHKKWSSTFR